MPRNHSRSESGNFCVVCCENIEIFAVGQCDHPICYVCSVRMRVLGKEKYCAVCRTDLDKVLLTKKHGKWSTLQEQLKHGYTDKESGLCYADKEVHNKVNELLQYSCPKCLDKPPERTLNKLRDHLKREHHLYFCDICLKHLQKFTYELKVYTRADLAKHRRVGDSGDTAYKGHPLCEFCDDRFLDDEYLHRHLRKNHFWCHICEKDGKQLYFHDYVNLRDHFRDEHYLCEEDMCKYEQYTSVFRSEIDLQAHIALKHSQKMTKAQVRQARQVEVDLVFNRPSTQGRNVSGQDYHEVQANDQRFRRNRGKGRNTANNREEDQNVQAAIETSLAKTEDNNPSLQQKKTTENPINESKQALVLPENDFPLLNGEVPAPKTSQNTSQKPSPKATRKTEAYIKTSRALNSLEDFPVLGGNTSKAQQNGAVYVPNTSQFSPKSTRNPEAFKKAKGLSSLDDFPTLGKPSNAKQNEGNDVKTSKQSSPKMTRNPEAFKKKAKGLSSLDDFPTLGKPSNTKQNEGNDVKTSKQSSPKMTRNPEGLKKKPLGSTDEDFPTLGKPSNPQQNGTQDQNNTKVSKPARKQEVTDKKNKALDNLEDFPNLGKPSKSQPKIPPPGFSNAAKKPSEPSQTRPPPGFQSNFSSQPQQNANENSSQISTQFSDKVDDLLLPKEKPKAVTNNEKKDNKSDGKGNQSRNQNLIENIKALLGDDQEKFVEFKKLSGKFRQGQCSAEVYYNDCTTLFGPNFAYIFSELVTLLPDKEKQEELLRIHNDVRIFAKQSGKPLQQSNGKKMLARDNAWGPLQTSSVPAKKEAWQKTKSDAEFPSLPPPAPRQMKAARIYKPTTNLALKSAWVRGK